LETAYQSALPYLRQLREDEKSGQQLSEFVARIGPKNYQQIVELRYLRLLAMLRGRSPDARAGYSIFIYRLTREDLDRAMEGPAPELLPAPRLRG
jgi:hypothetical protein